MSDKFTDNQLFNLISGSRVSGESTYDVWKSLGNEGDANDFLEYLKEGATDVSPETLAQIEQNKNDISQLSNQIVDLNANKQPVGNYALKSDIPTIPVTSVNGKTGEVVLNATDIGATTETWVQTQINNLKAQGIQQVPLFAEDIEDCTDTTKMYVLPDGYIYAYLYQESTGPSYTNLLPLATDTDRKTIFNGTGYADGYRLNSSGVASAVSGMMVTGFIPVKYGDIIRVYGVKNTSSAYGMNFAFYDSSNTFLTNTGGNKTFDSAVTGWTIVNNGDGTYNLTIDTTALASSVTSKIANCDAIRMATGSFANAIITVNEEITEDSGTTGGYAWLNTGFAFVPAEYEERIVALEQLIASGNVGKSLTIKSVSESTEDGGNNVVTFSDGSTLTVKNGKTGAKGSNGTNGTVQIDPLFAESVSWLNTNGDTSKLYILPDNFVYAYMSGSWKNTGNSFISTDSSCMKYLSDRNTYIAPVPSGYCESAVEYDATATHYLTKYDFATMTGMFTALATANADYVTETTLGKDSTGTYDIKSYVLDAPTTIPSNYESAMTKDKPTFIITSGLHGVEPDAVHEVYHFMKDLCENHMENEHLEYLRNNVRFVIVPISNPWGYVNQKYNNSNDVDLNKNFEHGYRTNGTANTGANAYSEAETVLLKGVFDSYPNAIFHLECHGKYSVDTSYEQTIWFSLMRSLNSELIEICADTITKQIGRRLYKLGYATNKSVGGYVTYYDTNGRPKDYTGTEYGMLSATMEGTGRIYGEGGYSVNTQKVNTEALENFILRVLDSLNSRVEI